MGRAHPRCSEGRRDEFVDRYFQRAKKEVVVLKAREPAHIMIAIGAGDHWHLQFSQSSEGKIVCIIQAPDERALATWFQKMQMPCDSITAVELEGNLGTVKEA
jgi:hypothetical protein